MAGTREGGLKAHKTNVERHGEDFYKITGSKGGKALVPKGFARMTAAKRRAAGRKGGAASLRGKTIRTPEQRIEADLRRSERLKRKYHERKGMKGEPVVYATTETAKMMLDEVTS